MPLPAIGPLPQGTTLVEASAGTGKTFQITSLVLRALLRNDLTIDRLLVVTFTEAATSELRDRVRTRLRAAALAAAAREADPTARSGDPLVDGLLDDVDLPAARLALEGALRGFDEASIFTIHGFCQRMLRQHAFESGTDFELELATDLSDLIEELVRDFLTRRLHAAPAALVRRLQQLGVGLQSLLGLARRVTDHPDLAVLPASVPAPAVDLGPLETAMDAAARAREGEEAAITRELLAAGLHASYYKAEKIPGMLESAAQWLALADPLHPLMESPSTPNKWLRADLAASKAGKKGRPPVHPFLECWQEVHEAQEALFAELDEQVLGLRLELLAEVRRELPRRKAARHVMGFSDLLHGLAHALTDPQTGDRLAASIGSQFGAALIDEFQDTDPVQFLIFQRIFGGGAHVLYLIGDPKQAIYGFRGADIFAYLAARGSAHRTESMDTNWRTDLPLVDGMNQLFGRPADPFLQEGIAYQQVKAAHPTARLRVPTELGDAPFQIRLIRRDIDDGRIDERSRKQATPALTKGWAGAHLPALVAADIARLLASEAEIEEDGRWRRLRPGDCAVLVATNLQATNVQAALRAQGIPSVLHVARSVFRTEEASDLERLLTAAAEPGSAGALRAALATGLVGIGAAELSLLQRDEPAWEAWVARFRGWHETWRDSGFMHMFRQAMTELELPVRLVARPDGERRLTNLLHLAELVHEAAAQGDLGPLALRRWLHRELQEETGDAEARQLRLESDADAVELITIHRSKGLEYGLCWCPFLYSEASIHPADKEAFTFHDPEDGRVLKLDIGSEDFEDHAAVRLEENRAEDMRLLYVALTRARHRCTVIWGNFARGGDSPLGHLLHGPAPGGDPDTNSRLRQLEDAAMLAELQTLAAPALLGVSLLAEDPAPLWRPEHRSPDELHAGWLQRLGAVQDRRWRRSSFSEMSRGAHDPGPDVDAHTAVPTPTGPRGPLVPLSTFPAGAGPGTFFHALLEHLDFREDDPIEIGGLVAAQLLAYGLEVDDWRDLLVEALPGILATPLGDGLGGLSLAALGPGDRLNELDFLLPVAGGESPDGAISPAALAAVFRAHGGPELPPGYAERLAALPFLPVQGFLTGSIDLIYRAGERWYVVDYKTNRLGLGRDDYDLPAMTEAMAHHHYFLQAHLYTVALHRFLRWRLPDYAPERHLGGAGYLFLRGMSPTTGPDRGVLALHPSPAMVHALDALIAEGAP